MRKKILILGVIFVFFLVIGLAAHLQQGQYLFTDFWTLQKDGGYAHQRDVIRRSGDGFELLLNGREMRAALEKEEQGWRMTCSDGWEVWASGDDWFTIEVDGVLFLHGDSWITLRDLDAMGLRFEPALAEERTPFYDEAGHVLGESILLLSESGHTLAYREEWLDQPEWNQPEWEIVHLTDGMTLDMENHEHRLYVNDRGEYLLNPDSLFYVALNGKSVSKNSLAQTLVRVAEQPPERRGHWLLVLLYAALYLMGAATLLWPEKLAFLGSRWRYQTEPELSDAGLMMECIGGVVLMGLGVWFLLQPLLAR